MRDIKEFLFCIGLRNLIKKVSKTGLSDPERALFLWKTFIFFILLLWSQNFVKRVSETGLTNPERLLFLFFGFSKIFLLMVFASLKNRFVRPVFVSSTY